MKYKVTIEGYVEAGPFAMPSDVEEAVLFQLGLGSMCPDNPCGEPDWDEADVTVENW